MIEREIEIDGILLRFHEYLEPLIDFENNRVYVVTKSFEELNSIEFTKLRAIVTFDAWSPELMDGLESAIQTEELKLYVGIEPVVTVTPEMLKNEKRALINAERDRLEKSGFPYMSKMIDSDMQSVNRINTTFSAAMACYIIGQPFTVEWTCADNSPLELDAQGMIGMPQALAAYGSELHYRATELKNMVNAITSTDLDEVRELLAAIPLS
jgi:hypothetical protein